MIDGTGPQPNKNWHRHGVAVVDWFERLPGLGRPCPMEASRCCPAVADWFLPKARFFFLVGAPPSPGRRSHGDASATCNLIALFKRRGAFSPYSPRSAKHAIDLNRNHGVRYQDTYALLSTMPVVSLTSSYGSQISHQRPHVLCKRLGPPAMARYFGKIPETSLVICWHLSLTGADWCR